MSEMPICCIQSLGKACACARDELDLVTRCPKFDSQRHYFPIFKIYFWLILISLKPAVINVGLALNFGFRPRDDAQQARYCALNLT